MILAYVLANAGSADATSTTLAVNYYIQDTMFFMGAAISHKTLDNRPVDDSETDWGVAVGVTTIEGLLVTTDYFNDAGYDLNLSAKYVKALKGETAFNLEASFEDAEEDIIYAISGDYYFNKKASLGASIVSADGAGYGIQGNLFVINEFGTAVEYFTVDSADLIGLEASYRF